MNQLHCLPCIDVIWRLMFFRHAVVDFIFVKLLNTKFRAEIEKELGVPAVTVCGRCHRATTVWRFNDWI